MNLDLILNKKMRSQLAGFSFFLAKKSPEIGRK